MSSAVSERLSVQDLAKRYESEGYEVLIDPARDEMPEFLRFYHPDLVAIRPDRSVVVEVKSPRRIRRTEYWHELMNAVRSHPGWHLEILANGTGQTEQQDESISQEEVYARISQSEAIAGAGEIEAALLIAWSATEAAMRLVAERFNVEVADQKTPRSLISRLFSEGLMDREDYDFLAVCMKKRNAVAHGYRSVVTPEELARLNEVTQTLLTE